MGQTTIIFLALFAVCMIATASAKHRQDDCGEECSAFEDCNKNANEVCVDQGDDCGLQCLALELLGRAHKNVRGARQYMKAGARRG